LKGSTELVLVGPAWEGEAPAEPSYIPRTDRRLAQR
jgi:hypothetical protein